MKAHKTLVLSGLAMTMATHADAAIPSFGADQHNDMGQALVISVRCPRASNTPVTGYISEHQDGLSKTDRPAAVGQDALVLLVPAGWWYKLVQVGDRCTATVAAAPHLRFTR